MGGHIHRPLGVCILRTDTNNMHTTVQYNCIQQQEFLSRQDRKYHKRLEKGRLLYKAKRNAVQSRVVRESGDNRNIPIFLSIDFT